MKTISVKVIPNSKQKNVVEVDSRLKVYATAPAVDGKANKAVIDLLSKFFNVNKSGVKIINGNKSRDKVVEIKPKR